MKKFIKVISILLAVLVLSCILFSIPTVQNITLKGAMGAYDIVANRLAAKSELPSGVKNNTDVQYVNKGSLEQVLDIYYPEARSGALPVIIYAHGGGFISGNKKQTRQFCMNLSKEGYVVFNINYRLAPKVKNQAQISDVISAVKWVEENCSKYNGDKDKIVLAGNSAGAYHAAFLTILTVNEKLSNELGFDTAFLKNRIKGLLLFNGVYDLKAAVNTSFPFMDKFIEMFLGTDDLENYKDYDKYSVIANMTNTFPKSFISSGDVDSLHTESLELIKTLDKNGVYHKDCLFDKSEKKANHDYHLNMEAETSKQCLEQALEFLEGLDSEKRSG